MSEVNQAYLRAYLKSRVAQDSQTANAPTGSPKSATMQPDQMASRPAAAASRPPVAPSNLPNRTLPSGENLRFDSMHTSAKDQNPRALPEGNVDSNVVPSPRQGVWSPIGVERGMKAMESMSVPAIVRNGVQAVSRESAQPNRPVAPNVQAASGPALAPAAPSHSSKSNVDFRPASNAELAQAQFAQSQFDQVVFVDGLQGHSNRRTATATIPSQQHTLAEITEPIAFGTGSPVPVAPPTPHARRPVTQDVPAQRTDRWEDRPQPHTATPEQPISLESTLEHSPTAKSLRFDTAHVQSQQRMAESPINNPIETKPAPIALPVPFTPSWEVDTFYWPEVVKQIEISHQDAFHQIGKHLRLANRDGLKVMAITSGERGVGRSTVAMHMARCAAAAGLKVALVDGDTFCPSLVDQLRLDMQHGWQDCLFENVPLHEAAIHSIADQITLFPLTSVVSPMQMHANLQRIAKLIKRISTTFDMVFIDANRLNLEQRDMVGVAQETIVDAAIIVVDTELSIKEKVDSAVSILQGMGLSSIGLVENFQS